MRRPRGPAVAVALLMVVLSTLSGCASVPFAGPVQSAPVGLQQGRPPLVPVRPDRPEKGDSRPRIVEGFLGAMASYQADYQVAREYLAPTAQETWKPKTIEVHETTVDRVSNLAANTVQISAGRLGTLGVDGGWTPAPRDAQLIHVFRFVQVKGEWRIANPPPGLLMSGDSFRSEYIPFNLYFFDPSFKYLVPDLVYLPFRGSDETMLVQALLRGPTTWLKPAVRTAFPEGTRLTAPAVRVVDNIATVDLDNAVRRLQGDERKRLSAQLVWTLRQLPEIDRLRITTSQTLYQVAGADSNGQSITGWDEFGPEIDNASAYAYARTAKGVAKVAAGGLLPVAGNLGNGKLPIRSFSLSVLPDQKASGRQDEAVEYVDRFATVSRDGRRVHILPNGGAAAVVYEGQDVLTPSWDRNRQVWLADRRSDGTKILVIDQLKRDPIPVDAPGLKGDLIAFKVSRDAVRVAALVRDGKRVKLMMGWIDRTRGYAIRNVRELPLPLDGLAALSWVGVGQLAVVGRGPSDVPSVTLVSTDGYQQDDLGQPSGSAPVSVAVAPGRAVLIGANDGNIYRDTDQGWELVGAGELPTYPG